MSRDELLRATILERVESGALRASEAADRLKISLRHFRRLQAAYRKGGAAALAHGNRGRKPAIAFAEEVKKHVLELAGSAQYADFNDTHLSEILAEREGVYVARPTLRRWRREAGQPSPRKRRAPKHRRARERAAREGQLLQIDCSPHDWFEGRGPVVHLAGAIDDATGKIASAHFREQEDTEGYFIIAADILRRHGLFGALYHDGRTTFVLPQSQRPTLEEQLEGKDGLTQFGRAMDYLGVTMIQAGSPQAKGRIERLWGTMQDRLIKEMRLEGISSIEQANAFMPGFIERYNARFGCVAADPEPGYLPLPRGLDVQAICCNHHLRTVTGDNTVSVNGLRLQLPRGPGGRSYKGCRVTVQERLDGTWAVYDGERCLARRVPPAPPKAPRQLATQLSAPRRSTAHTPSPDHPWRKGFAPRPAMIAAAPTQPCGQPVCAPD